MSGVDRLIAGLDAEVDRLAEAIFLAYANNPDARWDLVDEHYRATVWRPKALAALNGEQS